MALYNVTALQGAEWIGDLVVIANNATSGLLVGFTIIAIFIIGLLAMKKYDIEDVIVADSFVCFILSAVAAYGAYTSYYFPLVFLIILAFSTLFIWMRKN